MTSFLTWLYSWWYPKKLIPVAPIPPIKKNVCSQTGHSMTDELHIVMTEGYEEFLRNKRSLKSSLGKSVPSSISDVGVPIEISPKTSPKTSPKISLKDELDTVSIIGYAAFLRMKRKTN